VDYLSTQVVKLLVQELMLQENKDSGIVDQVVITVH
jgi:hypothetical protein